MDLFSNVVTKLPTVGFTGTGHQPLTNNQKINLEAKLLWFRDNGYKIARHGDCIHADTEFHYIALRLGYYIVVHPPINSSKASGLGTKPAEQAIILREQPKPYLDRNHDIVDNSDILIACPKENTEQLRSGTWSTVRYARKKGKQVYLILP
jgi:hypothetical protein